MSIGNVPLSNLHDRSVAPCLERHLRARVTHRLAPAPRPKTISRASEPSTPLRTASCVTTHT